MPGPRLEIHHIDKQMPFVYPYMDNNGPCNLLIYIGFLSISVLLSSPSDNKLSSAWPPTLGLE